MSSPRLAFKAGRAYRRENTNWVDPNPVKGAIILQNGDDGLMHFIWKNRTSDEVVEDLILFPGDAQFVKVPQSTWGRTYVPKFSSSNQRHFFWMQDADTSRDDEFVNNANRLLDDPEAVPIWNSIGYTPDARPAEAVATPAAPQASSSQSGPSTSAPSHQLTPEQVAAMRQILSAAGSQSQASRPEFLLQDILTPANLLPLFTSHPEIIPSLFPHLPTDLPTPPSAEVLQQIISSPQFRSAVRSFDVALSTGELQDFVRSLGLPAEAGSGFEAFLRAIQQQAEQQSNETMDTD